MVLFSSLTLDRLCGVSLRVVLYEKIALIWSSGQTVCVCVCVWCTCKRVLRVLRVLRVFRLEGFGCLLINDIAWLLVISLLQDLETGTLRQ